LKTYRAKRRYRKGSRRYRRYRRRWLLVRGMISALAMVLVVAGLGIIAYSLMLGEDSLIPRAISSATKGDELAVSAPEDTTLKLTVPKMARVEDLPVYDAPWDDETALDASAGHVEGTGFPWEEGANVYIAGHRMGFPGTRSFLVFYDLDKLENGDEVFLTDAEGTRYSYSVFDKFVADPYDWGPTEPIPGKSVVTLQTCTLPDYTQRLIVQAELVEATQGTGSPQERDATVPSPQAVPQQEEVVPQEVVPLQEEAVPQEVVPLQEEPVPQEAIPQEAVPLQEEAVPQEAG
jgi:sortase A